ncbi:hypothetical protein SteCoe_28539 [Stentor coeruleus]|uniref:Uncharacterized protein n=1 Tax=Stentor coeruleus TaxID=5963 RepID=A0A1R2B7Z8_9CILI|nr:hypothetical protein SteCoe_28539 [Stentor coeruleus]
MGNIFAQQNDELLASLALIHAHYRNKMALKYQITSLTIRENYIKTNQDPRLQAESNKLAKMIQRKLLTLHELQKILIAKAFEKKSLPSTSNSMDLFSEQEIFSLLKLDSPYDLIKIEKLKLDSLRNRLTLAKSHLSHCKNVYNVNQKLIDESSIKTSNLIQFQTEISDLKHYIKFYNTNNELMSKKKNFLVKTKSLKSLTAAKEGRGLPTNVILLKSKKCMKIELEEKILRYRSSIIRQHGKVKKGCKGVYDRLMKKIALTPSEKREKEELDRVAGKIKEIEEKIKCWIIEKGYFTEKSLDYKRLVS